MEEKILKIKAHIDRFKDNFAEYLSEPIMDAIPYDYEDDVFEFEIVIRKVENITEQVGVDEEGFRAFDDVEVKED